MVFSSITFLFYFLPIVLLVYYAVPKKCKNIVLLIASLAFYFYGEPKYTLLMIFSIVCTYFFGLLINKYKKPKEIVEDIVTAERYSIENEEEIDEDDESNYTVNIDNDDTVITPYVIEPERFGEYNEYGTKTLTYYADNVLTDEIDNPITSEEMVTMIGPDALDHFGEYEDDSVYIRDEMNEMDYEILKSEKKFSEIPERGRAN